MTRIATFSRHHTSESAPYRAVVSGRADAVNIALAEFGLEAPIDTLKKAVSLAKEKGQSILEVDDCGETRRFVVWYKKEEKVNFGLCEAGEDDSTDKHESIWITVQKFVPNQKKLDRLAALSSVELASKLLLERKLRLG